MTTDDMREGPPTVEEVATAAGILARGDHGALVDLLDGIYREQRFRAAHELRQQCATLIWDIEERAEMADLRARLFAQLKMQEVTEKMRQMTATEVSNGQG